MPSLMGYTAFTLKFFCFPKQMTSSSTCSSLCLGSPTLLGGADSYYLSRLHADVTSSRKSSQSPTLDRYLPGAPANSPCLLIPPSLLLWHILVYLPHQNVNSLRTGPVSFSLLDVLGAEDGNYSINVCSMGEWNTQQMFSLQAKQREGNLPYQYLRKNNFRTKTNKYFIFNTLVTTYTQETVFVSRSAANKRKKARQTYSASSHSKSWDERKMEVILGK